LLLPRLRGAFAQRRKKKKERTQKEEEETRTLKKRGTINLFPQKDAAFIFID
jgi:hypothetical protein